MRTFFFVVALPAVVFIMTVSKTEVTSTPTRLHAWTILGGF